MGWWKAIVEVWWNFVKEYDNKDVGYVLEVDLEYPIDLYDKHNAYPLEPE